MLLATPALATPALATPASFAPLLEPADLAALLAAGGAPEWRIVDIRDAAADAGAERIAGAQAAPYARWRGPTDNPGRLPSVPELTRLVQSLGIAADTPVAIVFEGTDASDFGAAARVAWTLRAAGVQRVAIVNGGMTAWRAAGLPLVTQIDPVAPTRFAVQLDPALIATRTELAGLLVSAPSDPSASTAANRQGGALTLLDARPPAYFLGQRKHAAARSPGTLPGARNVDYTLWFEGDSARLRDAAQLRALAARAAPGDGALVSFCNTGHWAAIQWFVLSEVLGRPAVRLYPESMVDWSQAGLAMDHVPGRLQQFAWQLRAAFGLD